MRPLEHESRITNPDLIAVRKDPFLHRYAVHERAVPAVEVLDAERLAILANDAMPARHE